MTVLTYPHCQTYFFDNTRMCKYSVFLSAVRLAVKQHKHFGPFPEILRIFLMATGNQGQGALPPPSVDQGKLPLE